MPWTRLFASRVCTATNGKVVLAPQWRMSSAVAHQRGEGRSGRKSATINAPSPAPHRVVGTCDLPRSGVGAIEFTSSSNSRRHSPIFTTSNTTQPRAVSQHFYEARFDEPLAP